MRTFLAHRATETRGVIWLGPIASRFARALRTLRGESAQRNATEIRARGLSRAWIALPLRAAAVLALVTWLNPAPAHAGGRAFTAPISVDGEDSCLECLVANVGNRVVKVAITAYDANGVADRSRIVQIDPRHTSSTLSFCDDVGNYTCAFKMEQGDVKEIRAGACEFQVALGCGAAVVARPEVQ